jgi:putative endonuclease
LFIYLKVNEKTYVGLTNNIQRRLYEHNSGKSKYSKAYIPWELIYSEKLPTRKDARVREKYLKSTSGRRFIRTLMPA